MFSAFRFRSMQAFGMSSIHGYSVAKKILREAGSALCRLSDRQFEDRVV